MTTARSIISAALSHHLNRLSPGEALDAEALTLDGGDPLRVAMAQRADRNTRSEIEISLASIIPHVRPASAHQS